MLLSMTGHGEAHCQQDGRSVAVEVRTVNNRYFKLVVRCTEGFAGLESRIESTVRSLVRRGTVQVDVKVDRLASPEDYRLNEAVLASYRRQLAAVCARLQLGAAPSIDALLGLPGVVDERLHFSTDEDADWGVVESVLVTALGRLSEMRAAEGRALERDLRANLESVSQELQQVAERAPDVVSAYQVRLADKLNKLLAEFEVRVTAADVIREVGMFAERCDISEEVVRLKCHLQQFADILGETDSQGRKLDFLTQEMFREANTIGSKANDAGIARHVVEMKAGIERLREMIQNVE